MADDGTLIRNVLRTVAVTPRAALLRHALRTAAAAARAAAKRVTGGTKSDEGSVNGPYDGGE